MSVTLQHSSTTSYQASDHIQSLSFRMYPIIPSRAAGEEEDARRPLQGPPRQRLGPRARQVQVSLERFSAAWDGLEQLADGLNCSKAALKQL
jgi:hypothetical protein